MIPADGGRDGGTASWRTIVPVALLIAMAGVQVTLTYTSGLSPWKGGGFGMFSTTDDSGRRTVRVFVSAVARSEEIAIAPSLEQAAASVGVLPGNRQFTRLARRVIEREHRNGRPVDTVRIETWRTEYAPGTLSATSRPGRSFNYRVDATPAAGR